ncbi:hypothetical protein [Sinomicrobium sp. M5D2P17]
MKALVYRQKNTLKDFGISLEEVADPKINETDISRQTNLHPP